MVIQHAARATAKFRWMFAIPILTAIAALSFWGFPWITREFLLITDQAGPFFFTFHAADLDDDGDLDLLVHNMRRPGEFEFFTAGVFWINQGGAQGGSPGNLILHPADIGSGLDSALADLDGDGDPDQFLYDGTRLILGINQGGVFQRDSAIKAPSTAGGMGVYSQFGTPLAGDINGDGRMDALILGCCGRLFKLDSEPDKPNQSWIWFNGLNERGHYEGFTEPLEALAGLPVSEAALRDLDSDGDLDLFAITLPVPGGQGSTSMVLFNDGAGSFADSGQQMTREGSRAVALNDLDGDGDPDALVGHAAGATVWINQGGAQGGQAGQFAAQAADLPGAEIRSVLLDDLDGDGDPDAVLVGQRQAEMWWNDGQGAMFKGFQTITCRENQDLSTADLNGDDLPDLILATYDRRVQVFWNEGGGVFRAAGIFLK